MIFRGIVGNGKVEFVMPTMLPEGTVVSITLVRRRLAPKRPKNYDPRKDPAFRIRELAVASGRIEGAIEHDHYIYGSPKRSSRK